MLIANNEKQGLQSKNLPNMVQMTERAICAHAWICNKVMEIDVLSYSSPAFKIFIAWPPHNTSFWKELYLYHELYLYYIGHKMVSKNGIYIPPLWFVEN